jgi:hypothetical protein
MLKKKLLLITMLSTTLPVAALASDAIETIAAIVLKLDQQPSVAEKKNLQSIVDSHSVTENERRLAASLINIDHVVRQEDKPKIRSVMVDPGASEQERELAKILYQVENQVRDEDKARLSRLSNTGNAEPKTSKATAKPAAAKKTAPAKSTSKSQ